MTRHRAVSRRSTSIPLQILEPAPSEPDPETSEPAPQADYYGGMDLRDHPVPGQKAGLVIAPSLPFPYSLGIGKDPNSKNDQYFNDAICFRFLSNLYQLLANRGRLNDAVQYLEGLAAHHVQAGSPTLDTPSYNALKKRLLGCARNWSAAKFKGEGPKIDNVNLSRLFQFFCVLFDFNGPAQTIMEAVCGPGRQYQPWYQKPLTACPEEKCLATFSTHSNLLHHLQRDHNFHDRPVPKPPQTPNEIPRFKCEICKALVPHKERDIKDHLESRHKVNLAIYAFDHLTNSRGLFQVPHQEYWREIGDNNLFRNLAPPGGSPAPVSPTVAKTKPAPTISPGSAGLSQKTTDGSVTNVPTSLTSDKDQELLSFINDSAILSEDQTFPPPALQVEPA